MAHTVKPTRRRFNIGRASGGIKTKKEQNSFGSNEFVRANFFVIWMTKKVIVI